MGDESGASFDFRRIRGGHAVQNHEFTGVSDASADRTVARRFGTASRSLRYWAGRCEVTDNGDVSQQAGSPGPPQGTGVISARSWTGIDIRVKNPGFPGRVAAPRFIVTP